MNDSGRNMAAAGHDWLRHAGVYGWPIAVQDALLTSLVTGQPLLFVSRHGCAKTFVAESLARWLGLSFIAVDASKSNWEDLIGFVSPAGLADKRVEYIPSPLSLWDKEFILIDELSRAKAQTANSYLELIRNRTLQGRKLASLRYVFAAMNPVDSEQYTGTTMLDTAMLSRFTFVVEVPALSGISDEDFLEILLESADPMNAPLLKRQESTQETLDLTSTVETARRRVPQVDRQERAAWALYLRALKHAIIAQDAKAADLLDMRTMNAVADAIIARRALSSEDDTEEAGFPAVGSLVTQCFGLLRLQNGALKPFPFESAHLVAAEAAFGIGLHAKRAYSSVRLRRLPLNLVPDELPDMIVGSTDGGKALVGHRLVAALKHPSSPEEAAHALACLCRLLCVLPTQPEPSALRQLVERLEHVYLTEHTVAVHDLMAALGMDPDALDDDPCQRLCLNYIAARESNSEASRTGSGGMGNLRQFLAFCQQAVTDAPRFIKELTRMTEILTADLERARERDGRLMVQHEQVAQVVPEYHRSNPEKTVETIYEEDPIPF